MKILFVSESYLPGKKAGGPIKSLCNLIDNLPDDIEPFVLTTNRDTPSDEKFEDIETGKWYEVNRTKVIYIDPNTFTANFLKNLVNEYNFDVIYFNSFLQKFTVLAYRYIKFEKKKKIIIATRGEFSEGALKQKKIKKQFFLFFYKYFLYSKHYYFHFTDKIEKKDFEATLKKKINYYIIPNFVSKPELYSNKIKEKNSLKIVSVSRISPMKNILYAINAIKKCVGNITYDIYGPIEDQDYWEKCAELISTLPENVNVQYMGVLDPSKVSEVYTQYDIFLSPTLGENFGHSIFEGMSAGCVPVISDRTPWRELEKKQIGWDISLDQVDKFTDVINKLVLMEDAEFSKIRNKLLCYSNRKYVELNNVQGLLDMFRRDEENTK